MSSMKASTIRAMGAPVAEVMQNRFAETHARDRLKLQLPYAEHDECGQPNRTPGLSALFSIRRFNTASRGSGNSGVLSQSDTIMSNIF